MLKNNFTKAIIVLALLGFCNSQIFAERANSAGVSPAEPVNSIKAEQPVQRAEQKTEKKLPHKKPSGKRKILKKFLAAMIGVAGSSFVIYFGLTLYNKYRDGYSVAEVKTVTNETPLATPDNLTDAVKNFLDKTQG